MSPQSISSTEAAPAGRVLIVEDEEALALGLRDALTHAGHQAQVCHDGLAALEMLSREKFDLVVLDLMLPGMSGFDVLKSLRDNQQPVRVLILTALADEEHILKGFQLGADDYLGKPFSARELIARIESQFRRRDIDRTPPGQLEVALGIHIDTERLEVRRDGGVLRLTPREGEILSYMLAHKDRVVTREDLLTEVWNYVNANVETRTVDIHIVGLRRKIEPDAGNPTLVQTVRGKGYRWGG